MGNGVEAERTGPGYATTPTEELGRTVGKTPATDGQPGGDALADLVSQRAAGRGDSAAAIAALRALLGPKRTLLRVADIEARIATGQVESPASFAATADRIAALPADARRGWDAVWPAVIATLRKEHERRSDLMAIARAHLTAGRGTDPECVEAIAELLKMFDRSVAAVEQLLVGAGGATVVSETEPTTESTEPTANPDRLVLVGVPPDRAAAYRAALALLDGKPVKPDPTKRDRREVKDDKRETTTPTSITPQVEGVSAGGGGAPEKGWGPWLTVSAEEVAKIEEAWRNPRLGMELLIQQGAPEDVARWVAFCDGAVPDAVRAYQQALDERAAMTGARKPLTAEAHGFTGGYMNFAIRDDGGKILGGAEIETLAKANNGFRMRLSLGFYETYVKPLIAMPERAQWIKADLKAEAIEAEVVKLEKQDAEYFAQTGRHDPQTIALLSRLRSQRFELQQWAYEMRKGTRNGSSETGRLVAEIDRIDKQLATLQQQLAEAKTERTAAERELAARRSDAAATRDLDDEVGRRSTGLGLGIAETKALDAARKEQEITARIELLRQQRSDTQDGIDRPGEVIVSEEDIRQRVRADRDRYQNEDGGYRFTSTPRAMLSAVEGRLVAAKARVWAAAGGLESIGGNVLSAYTGDPSYAIAAQGLQRRAFEYAAYWDDVAAQKSSRARGVLGDVVTDVLETVTTAGIMLALLAPIAVPAGAAGGAIAGAAGFSTTAGSTIGAMLGLGTAGGLMVADKSSTEIATSAVITGIMPLFGHVPGSLLTKVVVAFVGGVALDVGPQVNLSAAMMEYEKTGSIKDASIASVRDVRVAPALTNGLLNAFMIAPMKAPRAQLVQCGTETFRITAKGLEPAVPKSGETVVRVNPTELASVRELATQADRAPLDDFLARTSRRRGAVEDIEASQQKTDAEIAKLARDPAKTEQLGKLRSVAEQLAARKEVLEAAEVGTPIAATRVEAAGLVPDGYVKSGDQYIPEAGLAAKQSAAARATFDGAKRVADRYGASVERMKELTRRLTAEEQRATPNKERIAELRQELTKVSYEAKAARAEFGATTDGIVESTSPRQTIEIPADATVKPGGLSDVYLVGDSAIKVPTDINGLTAALDGVSLGKRYGGLGGGEVVNVKIDGKLAEGVKSARAPGIPLAEVGPGAEVAFVTQTHIDAFRTYVANAQADGVVLTDPHAGNILLASDGRVTIIDNAGVTFEKFAESARQFDPAISSEKLAADWATARENFAYKANERLAEMQAKRDTSRLLERDRDATRLSGETVDGLVENPDRFDNFVFDDPATQRQYTFEPDKSLDLQKPGLGIRERTNAATAVLFGELVGNARPVEMTVMGTKQRGTLREADVPPPLPVDKVVLDYVTNKGTYAAVADGTVPAVSPRMAAELARIREMRSGLAQRLERYLTPREITAVFERIDALANSTKDVTDLPGPLREAVIAGIARRGEYWGNNVYDGTCVHVGHRNAISAQLAGLETYVIKMKELTSLGTTLQKFGIDPQGAIARTLNKLGYDTIMPNKVGHVVCAIRGADGTWRYLSWGEVHYDPVQMMRKNTDWKNGITQEWVEPGAYVEWVMQNPSAGTLPSKTNPNYAIGWTAKSP